MEIKYRTWHKIEKRWATYSEQLSKIPVNATVIAPSIVEVGDDLYYEISIFTGMKDKNGKEIYEGDICRLETRYGETRLFEVKFGRVERELKSILGGEHCSFVTIFGFYFEFEGEHRLFPSLYDDKSDNERMEIVGNIYENQELMKDDVL